MENERPLPDLSNDPFLLKKDQMMREILERCPIPRHLLPRKRGNQSNVRSKR